MIKKFLILFMIILPTSCSAPGTALLGPAFTGATTKSVARASLSLTSNHIIKKIHNNSKNSDNKVINIVKKFDPNSKNTSKLNFHK